VRVVYVIIMTMASHYLGQI